MSRRERNGDSNIIFRPTEETLRLHGLSSADFGLQPLEASSIDLILADLAQQLGIINRVSDAQNEDLLGQYNRALDEMERFLGTDTLFVRDNEIQHAEIELYTQQIMPILQIVFDQFKETLEKMTHQTTDHDQEMVAMRARMRNLCVRLEALLEDHTLLESLLVSLDELGFFADDAEKVHVYDLCGGDGLVMAVASVLRNGREISGVCIDNNERCAARFDVVHQMFGVRSGLRRFLHGDIADAEIVNRPDARNVWIARYPEGAMNALMQRVIHTQQTELPHAIAVMSCSCHAYRPHNYPVYDGVKPQISENDWHVLATFSERADETETDSPEFHLGARARKIMDCVRLDVIHRCTPNLRGHVRVLPERDHFSIVLQPTVAY